MPKTRPAAQGGLPSVAIVTPSYNQAPFIRTAIESVLAQDYPDIEYLVVDAGSTDGTLEVLRSYGDRIRWISEPDSGQAEGIDKGIRLTGGEIIGWLNADDAYAPGAIRAAVEALLSNWTAPAVYGDATFIDADGREIGPCTHVEPYSLDRLINELDFIVQPATFFRRSAYQAAGGLDWGLRYCLDYDLMIRLGRQAPLVYLPRVQALVRVYPSTKTASGGLPRLDEIERMIRRHGRRSLPRWFQREMAATAWRELKLGVTGREWGRAARGAVRLARYGPRLAARRAVRLARRVSTDSPPGKRLRSRLFPEGISQRRMSAFRKSHRRSALPVRPNHRPLSLAVVVASYGHRPFLETTLSSLTNQTRPPDEVVLVDDCSPDGTREALDRLVAARGDDAAGKWKVISNPVTIGQAASLNLGIAAAECDLVLILNDDDYLMHDCVETMLSLFERYPDVALIGAHSIHFTSDGELAAAPKRIATHAGRSPVSIEVRSPAAARGYRGLNDLNMTHSGSCFAKSAWEAVGGYYPDPRKRVAAIEDRDFQLRVNALYPVGVNMEVPFSFWRSNSHVPRNSRDIADTEALGIDPRGGKAFSGKSEIDPPADS